MIEQDSGSMGRDFTSSVPLKVTARPMRNYVSFPFSALLFSRPAHAVSVLFLQDITGISLALHTPAVKRRRLSILLTAFSSSGWFEMSVHLAAQGFHN
ncbi:hypothetical protein BaRGS_00010360 [Batillaria attramentaria]|uniref:Uncharacterized protein n=1 Tax=Batillaria attramentaria TaxID=370345 RepID=A0ABD0LGR8_9CAEN